MTNAIARAIFAALAAAPLFVGASGAVRAECVSAFGGYSAACVSSPGPVPCDIDGRLKGVRVGSELFRLTMATFPGSRCAVTGSHGQLIFDANGVVK
jgi:hypothetical protein